MGFLGRKKKQQQQQDVDVATTTANVAAKSKRRFGFGNSKNNNSSSTTAVATTPAPSINKKKPNQKNTSSTNKSGFKTPPTATITSDISIVDSKSRGESFRVDDVISEEKRNNKSKKNWRRRRQQTQSTGDDDNIASSSLVSSSSLRPRNLLDDLNLVAVETPSSASRKRRTAAAATSTTTTSQSRLQKQQMVEDVENGDCDISAYDVDASGRGAATNQQEQPFDETDHENKEKENEEEDDDMEEIGMELILPSTTYDVEAVVATLKAEQERMLATSGTPHRVSPVAAATGTEEEIPETATPSPAVVEGANEDATDNGVEVGPMTAATATERVVAVVGLVDDDEDEKSGGSNSSGVNGGDFDISINEYEKYVEHQNQLEGRRKPVNQQQEQEQEQGHKQNQIPTRIFRGGGPVDLDKTIDDDDSDDDDDGDERNISAVVVEEKKEDDAMAQPQPHQQNKDQPAEVVGVTDNGDAAAGILSSLDCTSGSTPGQEKDITDPVSSNDERNISAAAAAATTSGSTTGAAAGTTATTAFGRLGACGASALASCGPCADAAAEQLNKSVLVDSSEVVAKDEYMFFNERFATKVLDTMLNVGFTLVYHQSMEDDFWVGRTVTMTLRPGVCTSKTLEHPCIEWTTMGGGKVKAIETSSIGLFDIDAVAISNFQAGSGNNNGTNNADNGGNFPGDDWCTSLAANCSNEELDCFFTLTSTKGEVHLFEALSPKESQRIVNGIRNLAARLSTMLIAGDPAVVSEFYDTLSFSDIDFEAEGATDARQPELSTDEVLLRLSHAFLDESSLM